MKKRFINQMRSKVGLACISLALMTSLAAKAENSDFALKTNVLYDATSTVNLGAEYKFAPKWSAEVSGNFISWAPGGHSYRHWLAQPGVRYWFCEAMGGHFVGAHLLGGQYNIHDLSLPMGLSVHDKRYQGWGIGGGVSYGYSWLLSKHWNIEAELGIGYVWTRYDVFECDNCGRKIESGKNRNYFGPTKAAVNLVYLF